MNMRVHISILLVALFSTALTARSAIGSSTTVCSMMNIYTPGTPLLVSLAVSPGTSVDVYAVEDQVPAGWVANNINQSGIFDAYNDKVKWGPFFDASVRTLTYQLIPPANATGTFTFAGTASFDGSEIPIAGVRQIVPTPQLAIANCSIDSKKIFHLVFTGDSDLTYTTWISTNLINWILLGTAVQASPGHFEFNDTTATNSVRRFYQVRWP